MNDLFREERLQQLRAKNDLGHSTCGRQRRQTEKRRRPWSWGQHGEILWETLGFHGKIVENHGRIVWDFMGFGDVVFENEKMRDHW